MAYARMTARAVISNNSDYSLPTADTATLQSVDTAATKVLHMEGLSVPATGVDVDLTGFTTITGLLIKETGGSHTLRAMFYQPVASFAAGNWAITDVTGTCTVDVSELVDAGANSYVPTYAITTGDILIVTNAEDVANNGAVDVIDTTGADTIYVNAALTDNAADTAATIALLSRQNVFVPASGMLACKVGVYPNELELEGISGTATVELLVFGT